MVNKIIQPSVVSLIITNCVLFALAVYYQLTLFDILLIFWGETVVIALFNFIKMIKVATIPVIKHDDTNTKDAITNAINFAVVMGKSMAIFWSCVFIAIFCLFQIVLIVALFGDDEIKNSTEFPLQHFSSFFIGMITVFASHAISFFVNFIGKKEYTTLKLRRMILSPFRRILLVWIVIIAGAFILLQIDHKSVYLLIPWFLLKIVFDIRQHLKERKQNQGLA